LILAEAIAFTFRGLARCTSMPSDCIISA
jgi:hypothetical protein